MTQLAKEQKSKPIKFVRKQDRKPSYKNLEKMYFELATELGKATHSAITGTLSLWSVKDVRNIINKLNTHDVDLSKFTSVKMLNFMEDTSNIVGSVKSYKISELDHRKNIQVSKQIVSFFSDLDYAAMMSPWSDIMFFLRYDDSCLQPQNEVAMPVNQIDHDTS